jgi:hypothetical protein
MTDIQGLRAQLRDSRSQSAPRISSSGGGLPFWAIAVGAAVVGFGIVLLAPRFFTMQRTAALPDFQEAASRTQPAESSQAPAPGQAAPPPAPVHLAPAQPVQAMAPQPAKVQPASAPVAPVSRYAGKTPEEVVRASDAACEHRALVVRNGGAPPPRSPAPAGNSQGKQDDSGGSSHKITAADEKLYCLLTEAPSRFCAPNQKRKVTADVINYFKGIEYTNAAAALAAKVAAPKPDGSAVLNKAEIDPRVVEGIEGLMRAGYLTKANRDEIGANVPRELKDRFARIVGSTPSCPKPPWWASFL